MQLRRLYPEARLILRSTPGPENPIRFALTDGQLFIEPMELSISRQWRDRRNLRHLRLARRIHRHLPRFLAQPVEQLYPALEQLTACDMVMDVSGGDSFADIYGPRRFEITAAMKQLVLDFGLPLVLLPQTYGPYHSEASRTVARQIISSAALVATREVSGIDELKQLLPDIDPARWVSCGDMAFTLECEPVDAAEEPWLDQCDDGRPLIGLNVSGLLMYGRTGFDFDGRYRELIRHIVDWAMAQSDCRLLLVPHVIAGSADDPEPTQWPTDREVSDTIACRILQRELSTEYGDRIWTIGWPRTAPQTKYLIGQCDFFIGARMHACIGAISQGIPTVTLAYSKKAQGVMGRLGEAACVLEMRDEQPAAVVDQIADAFNRRAELAEQLRPAVAEVRQSVERFFSDQVSPLLSSRQAEMSRGVQAT